jgi:hydroxymethylglutaryl-CoA synthase
MYMGFRSLLEFEHKKGTDLENKRVGFGSYGSGSSAMVFTGVIQPEYKEIVAGMDLEKEIGTRKKISINEYERLRGEGKFDTSFLPAGHNEFVLIKLKAGFREYDCPS